MSCVQERHRSGAKLECDTTTVAQRVKIHSAPRSHKVGGIDAGMNEPCCIRNQESMCHAWIQDVTWSRWNRVGLELIRFLRRSVKLVAPPSNAVPVCSVGVARGCRESVILGTSEQKLVIRPFIAGPSPGLLVSRV